LNVQVQGLDIAYERAGEGPALVFLHGVLSDNRVWRAQLAALADESTVVAWDEPGAGRSSDPPEDFGLGEYADCLAAFIAALEVEPAHVCGLSWGGVVAQELYRRHPGCVRSLILADTYAGWKGSLPKTVCEERLAQSLRQAALPPAEVIPAWLPGLLTENAPAELVEEVGAIMSDFHPAGFRAVVRAVAAADQRDLLPRIGAPTLLLWGEADARSPLHIAEQIRDAIPGARLVVIPGAGHLSNMEQPARFNAAVREFCRAVPG
jgi:pimeloyl-ACP methyl ester carboxylesterase